MLGIGVGEEQVDLLLADVSIKSAQLLFERALQMAVVLGDGQLGQADDVAGTSLKLSPDLDLLA